MTDTQSTLLNSAIDAYVVAVFREVMRVAAIVRRGFDADDIAATVAEEVLNEPEVIMARYPDPAQFARRRTRHAGISFDRTQRVQRAEGVRLYRDTNGQLHPGRRWASGNATVADGTAELFSFAGDPNSPFEAATDERLFATSLLQRCCRGLSPAEIREVWLVDGCGYTVQEVASMRGQRRETLSRRLNHTRRHIRQNRAAMLDEQECPE